MSGIQGLGKTHNFSITTGDGRHGGTCTSASTARAARDTYVSGGTEHDAAAPPKALTGQQLSELAERYDLKNMTRQEYGELLRELRDFGVITQKEFSDGYGGLIPNGGQSLPQGQERADILSLINGLSESCIQYGSGVEGLERDTAKALASSYERLGCIFSKINSFAESANASKVPEKEVNQTVVDGVRNAAAPAAKSARKTGTSVNSGGFQAVLEKTAGAEKTAQAAMPNFSRMSDRQKLAALAALHDSTDYSGMTDVEKHKLIEGRFESAFPDLLAYNAGLYGSSIIYFENPADQARHIKTTPELIHDELTRQYESTGITDVPKLHREAYYSGMTDEETIAAICKRHPGGSMADRVCILYEMRRVGVGDSYAIDQTLSAIVRNVDEQIKRSTRPTLAFRGANGLYGFEGYGYSDRQFQMARQIAGGNTGWADVRAMAAASIAQMGGHLGESIGKEIMDSIDELLDKLMKEGN